MHGQLPIWPTLNPPVPQADMACPGFREYHARLQTFLMWFIETASFIDVDDERWTYFLV